MRELDELYIISIRKNNNEKFIEKYRINLI